MSNVYNQQLSDALNKVKSASQQNELTENNTVQGAKLGLYHAHGITSKNNALLQEGLTKIADTAKQNQVASIAVTASQNIVTASNAAVVDASNTTSSASATAASIQKAATALTNLYGSVASTLAVANSLDNGTKIQRLVRKADEATKEAAKLAEEASILALNLTIDASQSRAAGVVTQAGAVKSNVTSLAKSLANVLSKQQEAIGNDVAAISSAVAVESAQAGSFKTADAEDNALLASMNFLNEYVNNNLACTVHGLENGKVAPTGCPGDQFSLSFNAFNETEDNKLVIEEYRLIIVKEDDAAAFNVEAAKSTTPKGYVAKKPDPKNPTLTYSQQYVTADYLSDNNVKDKDARFACDYNGVPVTRGVRYTFFVYVVYTNDYQTNSNDTNGLLSLAGPSFSLVRYLPNVDAANISLAFFNNSEGMRVAFKIPASQMQINSEINLNELMEFRTYLFSDNDRQALQLNQRIDDEQAKLFTLEATLCLKEETLQAAQLAYDSALIQEPQDAQDLEKKRKGLAAAKARMEVARTAYQTQKNVFEQALENKLSDFYVDEGIVETIPASNYITAKLIPDTLMSRLNDTQKTLSKESDTLQKQIADYDGELKTLNEQREQLMTDLSRETEQDTEAKGRMARIQLDIANNIKKLEAIRSEKISIETSDDAVRLQGSIPLEQQEQLEILLQIITDFALLTEVKGDEKEMSQEMEASNKSLKETTTTIVLKNAQRAIVMDQLSELNAALQSNQQHLTQLKTLMTNDKKGEFYYYEASDTQGDFTDNYGEPLMNLAAGESVKYCALILGTIKDGLPEASKLYQSRMSDFSASSSFSQQ